MAEPVSWVAGAITGMRPNPVLFRISGVSSPITVPGCIGLENRPGSSPMRFKISASQSLLLALSICVVVASVNSMHMLPVSR